MNDTTIRAQFAALREMLYAHAPPGECARALDAIEVATREPPDAPVCVHAHSSHSLTDVCVCGASRDWRRDAEGRWRPLPWVEAGT